MMAFITEENRAFYHIVSKMILIVLFTPLEFFSESIQKFLVILPTTYVVYPSAKILVNFNIYSDIKLILCQIVSEIIVVYLIYITYKKGVKDINVNGG
jgi:ABC-2 type transport system permease protein